MRQSEKKVGGTKTSKASKQLKAKAKPKLKGQQNQK